MTPADGSIVFIEVTTIEWIDMTILENDTGRGVSKTQGIQGMPWFGLFASRGDICRICVQ